MTSRCWQSIHFRKADPSVSNSQSEITVEDCKYTPVPLSPGVFVGTSGEATGCQRISSAIVVYFSMPGILSGLGSGFLRPEDIEVELTFPILDVGGLDDASLDVYGLRVTGSLGDATVDDFYSGTTWDDRMSHDSGQAPSLVGDEPRWSFLRLALPTLLRQGRLRC